MAPPPPQQTTVGGRGALLRSSATDTTRNSDEKKTSFLSTGKRHNKSHTLCRRCGSHSYHIQKATCSLCGYPSARKRTYNWGAKSIRRRTTGTGRMKYLRTLPRRFKNGFREGSQAVKASA